MFDMFDDLFLESGFDDTGVTLTEMESGFVWADCQVESTMERDPFDFITEAMYANVINANRLNYAILEEKYDYLVENGVEMVSEGVSVEGIKEFFKKVAQKIKDFFEAAVAKMVELQAKFRMLFEKGQKRAELGMPKVTLKVPLYTPTQIAESAKIKFKSISENIADMEASDLNRFLFTKEYMAKEKTPNFKEELDILKNYGKCIKDVKVAKNDALKAVKKIEKDMLKDANDKYERTHVRTDYAQAANGISAISRDLVRLIMKRVNASAKVINAAFKEGKDDYNKQKKTEKDGKKKTATGESALFDFI